jgi:hypothetical protein
MLFFLRLNEILTFRGKRYFGFLKEQNGRIIKLEVINEFYLILFITFMDGFRM